MRTGLATTFDELLCRRPPVSGTDVEGSPQQPPKQNTAAQQRPSGALRKTAESSTKRELLSNGLRPLNDLFCERIGENEGSSPKREKPKPRSRSEEAAQKASRPGVTDNAVEVQQIEEEEAFDHFPPGPLGLQTFPQTIRRGPIPNRRKSVPTRNPVMDNRESRRMLPLLIPRDGAGGSAKQRSANQDMARGPQAGMPKKKRTATAADDADPFKAFLREAASTDASTNKNENRHYDMRKKLERNSLLEKVSRPRPTEEWLYEMRTYFMGAAHEEMMKSMTRENVSRTTYLEHTLVPRSVDVPEVMEMTNMCKEWRKAFKIKTKAEEAKDRREAEKKEKAEAEKNKMMDFMGDSGLKGNLKK